MRGFIESLTVLLGATPGKPRPERISTKAQQIHAQRSGEHAREFAKSIRRARQEHTARPEKWRRRRWAVLLVVNLLFVVSYQLDIQALEGALTGSRFVGFHMADLNAGLQVILAFKHVLINLLIGIVTVFILWWFLGGRTFCSWVCPYHLLAEWAEILHHALARKKLVKDHPFDRRARFWLWVIFAVLAYVTGYTVYETISPTGIVSRALIYGPGLAALWVLALLVFEILYSQRAWCRYACPIGLTYGLVGLFSPLKVVHDVNKCSHEGACRRVCLVPHVLNCTYKGRAKDARTVIGADCTRCGRCVDACPTQALVYKFKVSGK